MKLQWKLTGIVVFFTVVAIAMVNLLLTAKLGEKDLSEAKRSARQTAWLIHSSLLSTMMSTGDYAVIENTLKDMQSGNDFSFRMVRSKHVIKQHGIRRNETAQDDLERKALKDGKAVEIQDTPNSLRIIHPFVTDKRCGKCHLDMNGEPVKEGVINGLAIVTFDLSKMQNESKDVIGEMMISLSAILIFSAALIIFVAVVAVARPMEKIASVIMGFREDRFDAVFPNYSTYEIHVMADEVKATAQMLESKKRIRQEELDEANSRNNAIHELVKSRAEAMGLDFNPEVSQIVKEISRTIDEARKANLMGQAFKYVVHGESKLVLPTDPSIIPGVSIYLGELVESTSGTLKKRSIELALDEALSNAIYYGNLGIVSSLRDYDADQFYKLADQRMTEEPYSKRTVEVTYEFDHNRASFVIKDGGAGFLWRRFLNDDDGDSDAAHGRGLMILRALVSDISFNEKGNEVTMAFDIDHS